ncbi:biotin-dependent carboxyltransferase family protein [Sulfurovum sp. CS9]|uniref:5-oxoprolinase subunit C family protein n=1 Tax=Sulfurovum sp. CS9 TaxID=3391146 RepID=UPI0039EC09B7
MIGFEVLAGGLLTTIQDLGRQGYTHLGITNSGAMDEYAYRWSQKLLDKHEGNALEILLGGLKLRATAGTTLAVCGANLDFRINNKQQPIWQTHYINEGDIISFNQQSEGLRAYLAVKGGFKVEKVHGSYAATIKEGIGQKLIKGDFLAFVPTQTKETRHVPEKFIPKYPKHLTLNILLSYQHDFFSDEQKEKFFNTDYELTPQISRMGYKLKGKAMIPSKGDIISEGITFGAVQIPQDGQPIILLKERQTIGGYPKIGSVLPSDCFKLAQLPIGSMVRFREINIEDAEKEMKRFYDFFKS